MQYLLGFAWGIVLLASFAGWGLAVRRILRITSHEGSPDWGHAIVLGMSWIIALGGFLNVLRIMTWAVVWLLLLGGLVLFAVGIRRLRSRSGWSDVFDWPRANIDVFVLLVCLVAYGSCVCLSYSPYASPGLQYKLNPWDDLQGGYITLPLRLLGEGDLGDDPFNYPRCAAALGGLSVLQSFPLLILPPTYIHVLDPGLAILALPLVFHGLGRRRGWPAWLAAALTLFCLVLRTHWVNATAQLLPTLFLLSLYEVLEDLAMRPRVRTSDLGALALLAMAVMTLKNVFIPGTCLILGIYMALDSIVRRDLYRSVVSGLTAGLILLMLLAPWLVSSYHASGTPLYPLLGKGYFANANSVVDMPRLVPIRDLASEARVLIKVVTEPRLVFFFLLGALGLAASLRRNLWRGRGIAYLAALFSSITILLLYARFFQTHWMRFSDNFITLSILTSFALLLGAKEGRAWLQEFFPGGTRGLGGFLILLVIAGGLYQIPYLSMTVNMVIDAIAGRGWDPNAELPNYRRMQASVPPGRRFLASLPMAHLLDYGRNPINVVYSSCDISPPPGLPLRRGPEDVARYLRALGISWVAAREPRDLESLLRSSESFYKEKDQWIGSQVYSRYLMESCIKSLVTVYETLRFENDLVLINLDRPRVVRVAPGDGRPRGAAGPRQGPDSSS
jgi:hypothetical protein